MQTDFELFVTIFDGDHAIEVEATDADGETFGSGVAATWDQALADALTSALRRARTEAGMRSVNAIHIEDTRKEATDG